MPKIGQKVNGSISFPYSMLGGDVTLHCGDVIDALRSMKAKSVHCVVTSPPYWGLRDYGVDGQIGSEPLPDCLGWAKGTRCDKCHVCKMVAVFHEIRRVLRDDGTVWLNYGDTYSGSGDLESGNLVGVPWRVALALQADGWILRQDIVWSKPSPMPESVTNRCTKAHEYVFLLAKGDGYYFDQEAMKEPAKTAGQPPRKLGKKQAKTEYDGMVSHNEDHASAVLGRVNNSNRRSVWVVSSEGFDGAHFATFPPKLIEPMILAGCPERVCVKCGAPHRRVVEKEQLTRERPNDYVKRIPTSTLTGGEYSPPGRRETKGQQGGMNTCANFVAGVETRTTGWAQGCLCNVGATGGTVLDPFMGSGTTACVAIGNGRKSIGVDLNAQYLRDIAVPRIEGTAIKRPDLGAVILAERPRKALMGGGKRRS